jgi:hypothetical protein
MTDERQETNDGSNMATSDARYRGHKLSIGPPFLFSVAASSSASEHESLHSQSSTSHQHPLTASFEIASLAYRNFFSNSPPTVADIPKTPHAQIALLHVLTH